MNIRTLAIASVSLLSLSAPAFAQNADADEGSDEQIVVTGTLIRGIAPGGSQSIAVGQDKIDAVGAANTSDLIASVPQAGNFLGFVGVRGSSNFSLAVNRPSLRYLGSTSASGASTLLLLDGHRMPGMGITQSSPDLDAIASGAIERVDIVTDGGSATYGSDAIGGVMNFITRKTFDGVEVKGNVGFADDYMQYNAGITAGKVWDGFSAYISYDFSKHDELYGRDRDWSQSRDWVNNLGASSDCSPGSIRIGTAFYPLSGSTVSATPGFGNRCDNTELATFYPKEEKHSVFSRIGYDNGGPVSVGVTVFYVHRENNSDGGPLFVAGGSAIPSSNPFAAPFLAALPGSPASGQLLYNLSPAVGNFRRQNTTMESWGITPTIKWDFAAGWQLNVLGSYGEGKSNFLGQIVNGTPINAAIAAGTFNPFNLTAAGNAATLATALDWFEFGRAKHTQTNARMIADGPLFALPAGDVRVAVGAEYLRETYSGNNGRTLTAAALAALPERTAKRDVWSVFGEINVPIVSGGAFESLTLTAAGRYDHYSDFGNTFNPKLGLIFEPVKGLRLRGNWGRSFQAPGMSDIALSGAPTWSILPLSVRPFSNPAVPPPTGRTLLLTSGGTIAPLSPQKAQTWSLGFDLKPAAFDGFEAGMTYYNIDYKGIIGFPPIFNPAVFYRDFPNNNVIFTAGEPAMQAYFNALSAQGATNAAATIANLPGQNFSAVYGVLDSRTQNLARVKTSGIDFYVRYRTDTSFGDVFFDMAGTRILTFDQQSSSAAALVNQMGIDFTKFRLATTLGANIGDLRAQVTWNHSGGYATTPTAANLQQASVGSFNVFNLFMQYKLSADSGLTKDMAFTLGVDNVFDKDPPLFRGAGNSLFGVANGFTLGRLVKFGISKKF